MRSKGRNFAILHRMRYFRSKAGNIPLPVFFPDATRGVIKTLDFVDLKNTKTPGILVNTFHLFLNLDKKVLAKAKSLRNFIGYQGALISDSGGFQIMSLFKKGVFKSKVTDEGINLKFSNKTSFTFTPEASINFQLALRPDMVIVLDEFTPPSASYQEAKKTVERTILWAKRSKTEYLKTCQKLRFKADIRPYLLGVVQGGRYLDLRKKCTQALVEIGFDGLGYGGWPIHQGKFNYDVARVIAENTPKKYFLFGLGIGKPEEIVNCHQNLGFTIFDCVLPTRDARHKRLYIYNADSIKKINLKEKNFYSFYTPDKKKYLTDTRPISKACDCLLCQNYSRGYLAYLFKVEVLSAMRLASIHNLRFFSILMEKLQKR